jgi:hemin uptake protein HemP
MKYLKPEPIQSQYWPEIKQFDCDQLFEKTTEIILWHKGEPYRLRITRQNKLILTK